MEAPARQLVEADEDADRSGVDDGCEHRHRVLVRERGAGHRGRHDDRRPDSGQQIHERARGDPRVGCEDRRDVVDVSPTQALSQSRAHRWHFPLFGSALRQPALSRRGLSSRMFDCAEVLDDVADADHSARVTSARSPPLPASPRSTPGFVNACK